MRIKYSVEVFDEPHFSNTITMRLSSVTSDHQFYAEKRLPLEFLQTKSMIDVVFEELKQLLKEEIDKQAGLV